MHTVRRQAHRIASANQGDGALNYNPFARQRPHYPLQRQDEENPYTSSAPDLLRPSPRTETPAIEDLENVTIGKIGSAKDSEAAPGPGKETRFERADRESRNSQSDHSKNNHEETLHGIESQNEAGCAPSVGAQLKIIFASWFMIILIPCIPTGFVLSYLHMNAVAVFCVNFVAIIPSATALSIAWNDLGIRAGEKVAALLNQTFGNAVQLIQSIFLLKSRQISVLKLSLVGIILSNLLLTTGSSFVFGGYNRLEQYFNVSLAQTISMLLLLAVTSLVIPSVAHLMTETSARGVLAQSRGIAVVVLISYVLWLVFTLLTHRVLFEIPAKKSPKIVPKTVDEGAASRLVAVMGTAAATVGGIANARTLHVDPDEYIEDDDDLPEKCSLSLAGATITLIVSIVLISFNTQFATDSIQAILQRRKVSQTFLSLIILPLLSNDPIAVKMAIYDKMDISISLALERCMQTCLLLVPLVVLLAWCMGVDEMDLEFDGFAIATLFVSIVIVTYVVQEGKSNWLTGALLIKVFIIIALAAFFIQ